MKPFALVICAFALAVSAQDFTCKPIKFHGPFRSNHAKFQISSDGVVGNLTASTGSQRIAAQSVNATGTGTVFHINSCNSTTAQDFEGHDQGCIKGQCIYMQYDYVQVVNPATGHCLIRKDAHSITNVTFSPCAPPASSFDYTRLFFLVQVVRYFPDWTATPQYDPAELKIVGSYDDGSAWAWSLAADRRTVGIDISNQEDPNGGTMAIAALVPS